MYTIKILFYDEVKSVLGCFVPETNLNLCLVGRGLFVCKCPTSTSVVSAKQLIWMDMHQGQEQLIKNSQKLHSIFRCISNIQCGRTNNSSIWPKYQDYSQAKVRRRVYSSQNHICDKKFTQLVEDTKTRTFKIITHRHNIRFCTNRV